MLPADDATSQDLMTAKLVSQNQTIVSSNPSITLQPPTPTPPPPPKGMVCNMIVMIIIENTSSNSSCQKSALNSTYCSCQPPIVSLRNLCLFHAAFHSWVDMNCVFI